MFFHSLKTKFITVVSVLIILLFGLTGFMLLKEKSLELSHDIYKNAKSFSELTAEDIVLLSQDYLEQDGFLNFNREVKEIFKKNEDISRIYLVTYAGEVLYDSETEATTQYTGEQRLVSEGWMTDRIKATNSSYLLEDGSVVYIKEDADGNEYFVNQNEDILEEGITEADRVSNIVYPYDGKYAVIYDVSYDNLQARIDATQTRIIILMLIGVVVAFFLSFSMASSVVKPVKSLEMGALKIATGDFASRVTVRSNDELGVLSKAFNKMASDLEISTKALVYKERVAKELELASKIQKEILPKEKPFIDGFDISGGLVPADEVGGDCYDFIKTKDGRFYFYLGDVTGHGVPAGIVASVANALLYSATNFTSDSKDILVNVNDILNEKTASNMFMTMVLASIDQKSGAVRYISAGHNQILKFNSDEKKVEEMPTGGIALGMVGDIGKTLREVEVPMKKGDVLIIYSDGMPEARNLKNDQYGMPMFKRAVSEYCDLVTSDGIKNALLADVKEFMGKAKQADDMTIVVVKKL